MLLNEEKKQMTFRIHDGNSEDSLVITADTIEEVRKSADRETGKRGWKDCWSEEVKQ